MLLFRRDALQENSICILYWKVTFLRKFVVLVMYLQNSWSTVFQNAKDRIRDFDIGEQCF